ncbi:hypothetical protein [Alteromonas genovensis]|uniref:hypothetical protein n=1 Tax=Alteromonas genovensis TaxID=471225 RepID=UPI002FE168D6
MIEKKYYRTPEFKNNFNFNHFDYQYLCESFNVPVHIFSYARYFILAERVPRSFKKIIRGVAFYSGIVELSLNDKKLLLRDGSVPVKTVFLDDVKSIQTLESCSRELLDVLLKGNYEVDYVSSTTELDLFQCDAILIDEENRDLIHHKDTPLPESLNIKFEDLVLKRELVDWCKLQLDIELDTSNTREHMMKEQIKLIHRANPHMGATKLYRLMLENFENDIDTTDPLSILISMDRNEIIWGKTGEKEQTMSLKTFRNIFSGLKKTK